MHCRDSVCFRRRCPTAPWAIGWESCHGGPQARGGWEPAWIVSLLAFDNTVLFLLLKKKKFITKQEYFYERIGQTYKLSQPISPLKNTFRLHQNVGLKACILAERDTFLYAFFSFCRFPTYFLRLQRSLCHQPWDLRPRGCLVGSEGGGEAGLRFTVTPVSSSKGPPGLEGVLGTRRLKKKKSLWWWVLCLGTDWLCETGWGFGYQFWAW